MTMANILIFIALLGALACALSGNWPATIWACCAALNALCLRSAEARLQ
jgi:hypothetical protein